MVLYVGEWWGLETNDEWSKNWNTWVDHLETQTSGLKRKPTKQTNFLQDPAQDSKKRIFYFAENLEEKPSLNLTTQSFYYLLSNKAFYKKIYKIMSFLKWLH